MKLLEDIGFTSVKQVLEYLPHILSLRELEPGSQNYVIDVKGKWNNVLFFFMEAWGICSLSCINAMFDKLSLFVKILFITNVLYI